MSWADITIVFFVSHLVGDFLVQLDWQAKHKARGLGGDPVASRALLLHVTTYTLAFVPALIWIGDRIGAAEALGLGLLIFIPHLIVDDGRLLDLYIRRVKASPDPSPRLVFAVDQSVHLICLWATALLAAALG